MNGLPLTPPLSPPKMKSSINLRIDYLETPRISFEQTAPISTTSDGILVCPFEVDYTHDNSDDKEILGHGAWSTVYRGAPKALRPTTNYGLLTPPLTPSPSSALVLAVKTPARKDAISIIRHEARTLTHLSFLDSREQRVAAFHGLLEAETSLVLSAHPLSLETHLKHCVEIARHNISMDTMSLPVLGSTPMWLDLATRLVSTLDWLHNEAMVVHGDIKPGNILLKPSPFGTEAFPYVPLLIDFSSSQRLDDDAITPNTLSAVTREYTAPELLSISVLKDPNSVATMASDVFSLAVTLLSCVTGEPLVYPGCNFMQRNMLASNGWQVISNVRNMCDYGPVRIPKQGTVMRSLERAVLKKDMGRISARDWKDLLERLSVDIQ